MACGFFSLYPFDIDCSNDWPYGRVQKNGRNGKMELQCGVRQDHLTFGVKNIVRLSTNDALQCDSGTLEWNQVCSCERGLPNPTSKYFL